MQRNDHNPDTMFQESYLRTRKLPGRISRVLLNISVFDDLLNMQIKVDPEYLEFANMGKCFINHIITLEVLLSLVYQPEYSPELRHDLLFTPDMDLVPRRVGMSRSYNIFAFNK